MDSLVTYVGIASFYLLVEKMHICVYYCKYYIELHLYFHRQYGYFLVEANVHEYMWLLL